MSSGRAMNNGDEEDDLEEVLITTIDEEQDIEKGKGTGKLESQSLLRGAPVKPALSKAKSGISRHVTLPSAEAFKDKVSQAVSRISGTGEKVPRSTDRPRGPSKDGGKRPSQLGEAPGRSSRSSCPCFAEFASAAVPICNFHGPAFYYLGSGALEKTSCNVSCTCRPISAASKRPKQLHTGCTTTPSEGPQGDELSGGPAGPAAPDQGIQDACNPARKCS